LAHQKNDKSIEIKESLNAQRGLIFSYKLRAQIYYTNNELQNALIWAEKAYFLAHEQNLEKELIATGIVLAKIYLSQNEIEAAKKIIENCIHPSKLYTLVHRLSVLGDICKQYQLDALYSIIQKELKSAVLQLVEEQTDYQKYLAPIIKEHIQKNKIDALFNERISLSQELLQLL